MMSQASIADPSLSLAGSRAAGRRTLVEFRASERRARRCLG